jgi:hypothetical protein
VRGDKARDLMTLGSFLNFNICSLIFEFPFIISAKSFVPGVKKIKTKNE